jgi:hypothetical protein
MEPPGDTRAVLFTRRDLPTPARKRRDAVVQELRCLADRGGLDSFDVVDWDKRVPVASASAERDRHAEFAAWTEEAGLELAPFFDTRLCYCTQTGEKREELVLPALCLAVYEESDLSTVAPHTDGPHTVSVEDAIDQLGIDGTSDDSQVATVTTH